MWPTDICIEFEDVTVILSLDCRPLLEKPVDPMLDGNASSCGTCALLLSMASEARRNSSKRCVCSDSLIASGFVDECL
jgi:hypothetical protein